MEVRGGFPSSPAPSGGNPGRSHSVPGACYHPGVISDELLEVLACPKCKQKVDLSEDRSALICQADRLRYPIVDDIPVMLIEEAETF